MDKLFPRDWYWLSDDGRIYSSRHQCLVADSDLSYLGWKAEGRIPTRWPEDDAATQTEASLIGVVGKYGLVIGESTLDVARISRISALSMECGTAIVRGFESAALGDVHTYPSDVKDQLNLMGSVTDSIVPGLPKEWRTPFWVRNEAGEWSYKMHDAAQIQQAGRDGKAHIIDMQSKLERLSLAVSDAKSDEEVSAIKW